MKGGLRVSGFSLLLVGVPKKFSGGTVMAAKPLTADGCDNKGEGCERTEGRNVSGEPF